MPATVDRPMLWTTGGDPTLEYKGKIDIGASAIVCEMYNKKTGKAFARKLLHFIRLDGSPIIENELRAITKLSCDGGHKNIIHVLTFGNFPDDTYAFIDMDLCDFNLEEYNNCNWKRINAAHRIPKGSLELEIWNIMKQIADGLGFIHGLEEVHRDLKPRNVLYSGRDKLWKLSDFGLTSEGSTQAHTTAFGKGTSGYRAPELLKEYPEYSTKVDIWAMGVILHELATGQKPFHSDEAVSEHYRSRQRLRTIRLNEGFDQHSKTAVYGGILDMLQYTPTSRPTAAILFQRFCRSYDLSVTVENATLETRIAAGKEYLACPVADQATRHDEEVKLPNENVSLGGAEAGGTSSPTFGCDPPKILRQQQESANECHNFGRYQETAVLFEHTAKRRKMPNHSDTPASQGRIAFTYGTLRQHQEAIEMSKEVVNRQKSSRGPDHPDTLSSQHNLAMIYGQLGQYEDAANLYQDIVERRRNILGPDHLDTLSSQHNLAMICSRLGQYENAIRLYQDVVERRTNILGSDHPDTLSSQQSLLILLGHLGKDEAATEHKYNLECANVSASAEISS